MQPRLGPPLDRRAQPGRRRHVAPDGPEHFWPMNPSGVQRASAIRPSGRQTRASSAAARSWSGANITPTTDSTASKDPSGYGSASASPCVQLDRQPLGHRPRSGPARAARVRSRSRSPGSRSGPRPARRCRCHRPRRAPAHRPAGPPPARAARPSGGSGPRPRVVAARPGLLLATLDRRHVQHRRHRLPRPLVTVSARTSVGRRGGRCGGSTESGAGRYKICTARARAS